MKNLDVVCADDGKTKKEPRKMDKLEAAFASKLKVWLKYNMLRIPAFGWEAKYPRTKNYIFASDKSFEKELRYLTKVWPKRFIYKFSDIARLGTPHDGFCATGKGYFFFTWDGKKFYGIDAITIEGLIDDGKKSIDEKMAAVLADVTGTLK